MADDENAAAPAFDPTPVVDGADSWEWDTVQKESPIGVTFEKFGDVFIGKYTGVEKIIPDKDDPFEILTFEDDRGKRYSISPSYKLQRAFYLVPEGSWCRITYVSNIDTGKAEPMKDYRVDVRRGTPVKTI
jgi:hypothetical protein